MRTGWRASSRRSCASGCRASPTSSSTPSPDRSGAGVAGGRWSASRLAGRRGRGRRGTAAPKPASASTPSACAQPASAIVRAEAREQAGGAARASRPGASRQQLARAGRMRAAARRRGRGEPPQREPEQQRQRGEQDRAAGEHRDNDRHERVVPGGCLLDVRPGQERRLCASAQPATIAATASRGGVARRPRSGGDDQLERRRGRRRTETISAGSPAPSPAPW